jgi:Ni/Fe-hydrogenase subunit HybB-like protein
VCFWIENALALLAALTFISKAGRRSQAWTFVAAAALMGFAFMYRIDAYLVAYQPAVAGYEYFPSAAEFLVTLGMTALEILLYLVCIKLFPVLDTPVPRTAHA